MERHHANMTGALCEELALAYGYKRAEAKAIAFASTFHDIGKSKIPEQILNKPGKLTPDEFDIIKLHTAYGYNLLKSIRSENAEMIQQIAMYHHERYDGNGYWGLGKESQPVCVRIVAIADVYTALIAKRVYKHAWPIDEALDYIEENSGAHFDPLLVDLFIGMLRVDQTGETARL